VDGALKSALMGSMAQDANLNVGGTQLGTYKFGAPLRSVTTSEATPSPTVGPNFLTLVRTVNNVSAVV